MSVATRLDQLQKKCADLGITDIPQAKKKLGKDDCVKALQKYHIAKRYPDGKIPKHLQFMLSIESPMLCFRFQEMDPDWQAKVWDDENWLAQDKINGVRLMAIYSEEEGLHFYSRNLSVLDYLPVEYKNIWLGPTFDIAKFATQDLRSFVLDCELKCSLAQVNTIVEALSKKGVALDLDGPIRRGRKGTVTVTPLAATTALLSMNDEDSLRMQKEQNAILQFHSFHVLEVNGVSAMEKPWKVMNPVLDQIIAAVQHAGMHVLPVRTHIGQGKKSFYDSLIAEQGEGVILKHMDSTYRPSESRYHRMWVKKKRDVKETLIEQNLGDSIDGFVTGFEKGSDDTANEKLIGKLIVSFWLRKKDTGEFVQHECARVGNLTKEFRETNTIINPDGTIGMNPAIYNKVVELQGQWFSSKSKRLVHPALVRFRDDKSPEACTFEEELMERLII